MLTFEVGKSIIESDRFEVKRDSKKNHDNFALQNDIEFAYKHSNDIASDNEDDADNF